MGMPAGLRHEFRSAVAVPGASTRATNSELPQSNSQTSHPDPGGRDGRVHVPPDLGIRSRQFRERSSHLEALAPKPPADAPEPRSSNTLTASAAFVASARRADGECRSVHPAEWDRRRQRVGLRIHQGAVPKSVSMMPRSVVHRTAGSRPSGSQGVSTDSIAAVPSTHSSRERRSPARVATGSQVGRSRTARRKDASLEFAVGKCRPLGPQRFLDFGIDATLQILKVLVYHVLSPPKL